MAKAHIRTTLFTQPPSRGEPVEKVDVGSVGGFEWSLKSPKSVFSVPYRGSKTGAKEFFNSLMYSRKPSFRCTDFPEVRQESLREYAISEMRVTALVGTLS